MRFYTNDEMIEIHRELLSSPIEGREEILTRYNVFKEEFPDVDFLEDEEDTEEYDSDDNVEGGVGSVILFCIFFLIACMLFTDFLEFLASLH